MTTKGNSRNIDGVVATVATLAELQGVDTTGFTGIELRQLNGGTYKATFGNFTNAVIEDGVRSVIAANDRDTSLFAWVLEDDVLITKSGVAESIYETVYNQPYKAGLPLVVGDASVVYQGVLYVPTVNFTTTGTWLTDRATLDVAHKQTVQESAYSLPAHRALVPRTSASFLYAFGDSQTAGSNAAAGVYYTDGAGVLLPNFRWPKILAEMYDNGMQVQNFAVGGSRLGWKAAEAPYSMFNQMGNLGPYDGGVESSNLFVVMGGWNNVNSFSTTEDFYRIVRRAHEANIARLLVDGWGAITHLGWADPNNGGDAGGAFSFATTAGAGESVQETVATDKMSFNPFYYGQPAGGRWHTKLVNSQYSEVTFTDKRSACVFLETDAIQEGIATISLNGTPIGTVNCNWTSAWSDDHHPIAFWIENLPSSAVIRVTCEAGASKNVRLLAIGYVEKSESIARKRQIIYGTTVANSANQHDPHTLYQCAKQCETAVGTFSEHGVLFANTFNHWVEAEDQEPQDISHLTPSGNVRVARAFASAVQIPFAPSVNFHRVV